MLYNELMQVKNLPNSEQSANVILLESVRYVEGKTHLHRACLACLYSHDLVAQLLKDPLCRGESKTYNQGIPPPS